MADVHHFRLVVDVSTATHDTRKAVQRELHRLITKTLTFDLDRRGPIDVSLVDGIRSTERDEWDDLDEFCDFAEEGDHDYFWRGDDALTLRHVDAMPVLEGELAACEECERSNGPHYRGPCPHGGR